MARFEPNVNITVAFVFGLTSFEAILVVFRKWIFEREKTLNN